MKHINSGVYPTMITPYNKDGSVDLGGAEALTEWYWNKGCHGIFAVCMSSEMFRLTLEERSALTKVVKNKADALAAKDKSGRTMSIVASGHISDNREDQIRELNAIYDAGADSVVLITNRTNPIQCSDEEWIAQTESVIAELPDDVTLGFYECPIPQKRLISDRMMDWMKDFGKVSFIKDTCCDEKLIAHRLEYLKGSGIKLFNANAQTVLPTLKNGAAGFSGVMGNFNPEIFVWLYENFEKDPARAEMVQNYLCASCAVESMHYPLCVKHLLKEKEGIGELIRSRMSPDSEISEYNKYCVERCYDLNKEVAKALGIK